MQCPAASCRWRCRPAVSPRQPQTLPLALHLPLAMLALVSVAKYEGSVESVTPPGSVLPPSFNSRVVNSTTSAKPWMATGADLNGDNNVDMIVVYYYSGVVWCVSGSGLPVGCGVIAC